MDAATLGELPRWSLDDLYPSADGPELAADLAAAEAEAAAFKARYFGRIASLTPAELGAALSQYEAMSDRTGRIISFAHLLYVTDQNDPEVGRVFQSLQEAVSELGSTLLFFGLELNAMADDALVAMRADPTVERLWPFIRDSRESKPYDLAEDLERLINDKAVSGARAWIRLFDETMAALRFEIDGERLALEPSLDRLSDKDRARRAGAAKALNETFEANIRLFAHITNTLAKDHQTEARWRGLPRPDSARHISNLVEADVVDALKDAVVEAYPRLSHRYYALKADWLGLARLEHWDRNAPLPDQDDAVIPWAEARRIVLDAYGAFSPRLAELGESFFEKPWIDAGAREGKAGGAFSHGTVPSAHPYILMNYLGKTRDVMTLAHELGHGVHQRLAAGQGPLLADTPLTLAETASVFGEQLTFRALLARQDSPAQRKVMLANKVEDMLNTVVRQIAFYQFELAVHGARADGELTPDALGEIWLNLQSDSLGPAFRLADDYRSYWCYIPHFIHSPFYVYAYAFGDCLVNALYARYQAAPEGFEARYIAMLSAGGSLRHKELLAPFGLDASDPAFWRGGLDVIAGFIDELEVL